MKVSDLKAFLDNFSDDKEMAVSIFASDGDNEPITTYAIGGEQNEFGEPTLIVNGF